MNMTRKEFMTGSGRIIIAILMLSGTGFLAVKRRISRYGICSDNTGCTACSLNTLCGDPRGRTPVKNGQSNT